MFRTPPARNADQPNKGVGDPGIKPSAPLRLASVGAPEPPEAGWPGWLAAVSALRWSGWPRLLGWLHRTHWPPTCRAALATCGLPGCRLACLAACGLPVRLAAWLRDVGFAGLPGLWVSKSAAA